MNFSRFFFTRTRREMCASIIRECKVRQCLIFCTIVLIRTSIMVYPPEASGRISTSDWRKRLDAHAWHSSLAFLGDVTNGFHPTSRLTEGCEALSNPIPRIIYNAVLGNCRLILGLGPSRTRNTKSAPPSVVGVSRYAPPHSRLSPKSAR